LERQYRLLLLRIGTDANKNAKFNNNYKARELKTNGAGGNVWPVTLTLLIQGLEFTSSLVPHYAIDYNPAVYMED
jgi:hypothetical protein